ncbi:MAG: hypothetical protein AB8F94_10155 [Saprospiraceae bacterium]
MVEALLLVDPSHEDFEVVLQETEKAGVEFFKGKGSSEVANENAQIIENFEILGNLASLPDVVLTSIKDRSEEIAERWVNAHATLGEGVSNFTHVITENSGHYIHIEEPQLVFDALESFQ